MKFFIGMCVASLMMMSSAHALDLQSAKSQGLVGETPNGYLASVGGQAAGLVAEVNAKRKAAYMDISKQNGQPLNVVETLAGQKLYEKLSAGEYYQDAAGGWKRK